MDIKNIKIDFVDDGEMMLKLAEVILTNAGFVNIGLFNSGTEFLEHYEDDKSEPPGIVFLDIKLDDIDGVDVLERARKNKKFSETIFVSLSGYLKNIDKDWLEYSGFDDALFKPINEKQLLKKIKLLAEMKDDIIADRELTKKPEILINKLIRFHIKSAVLEKEVRKLISPEVFEILETKPEDLIPSEQEIAVGFLDIRGFTKIYNMVNDAKKMGEILEIFFDFVCQHITKGGGFIDKFIGDSVMWFHKDNPIEKSCKQCFDAAIDIMKGMDMVNKIIRNEVHTEVPIKIGIGVACGKASVGIFGAPNYRIQYSALGSAVNLASHFCSIAKKDEIIIGDTIIKYCPYKTEAKGFHKIKHLPYKTELRKVIIPEDG
jgi:class 3 adenylate cyclase